MDNNFHVTDAMQKRLDKLGEEIKARDAGRAHGDARTEAMLKVISAPDHYMHGSKECIEYIDDVGAKEGYLLGNAIKYIFRHKHKGDATGDIRKAIKCLQMYVDGYKYD